MFVLQSYSLDYPATVRLIYILLSDTHWYRLRLLLLDAHCCRCYESCDCKLVDTKILKEWLIQVFTQMQINEEFHG
ncbi:hypothetical protein C0J52_22901 [Blattella germanica]|nr:hypothetical protein C0J52_22901 [Blattella germanica]